MNVGVEDQAASLRALVSGSQPPARPRATGSAREPRPRLLEPLKSNGAHLRRPLLRRASVVAIASGKGGVGKTSLSVSLAAALAQTGRRVILLDGDVGLANADVLCGVRPSAHIGHVISGERTLERVLVDAPGGFRLAPGASGLSGLVRAAEERPQLLLDRLSALERMCDALIIDCGAGINRIVRSFLAAADLPIVVATPEPTSLTDAYALLKLCVHDRTRREISPQMPSLLVNLARHEREAAAVGDRIAEVSRRFLGATPQRLGWVPRDDGVRDAALRRQPFVLTSPRRPASRAILALAPRVAGRLRLDLPQTEAGQSAIRRLLSLLQGS